MRLIIWIGISLFLVSKDMSIGVGIAVAGMGWALSYAEAKSHGW
jgi:hypothetical protein